jgi:hypothetical protein
MIIFGFVIEHLFTIKELSFIQPDTASAGGNFIIQDTDDKKNSTEGKCYVCR